MVLVPLVADATEVRGVAGYDAADLEAAVGAAVRAPSQHNTQPWLFRLRDGAIDVRSDPDRRLPVADPTGWAVRLACGAAVLNARLALAGRSRPAVVRFRPEPADPDLLARLTRGADRPATPAEAALLAAVPRRHSSRSRFSPVPVPPEVRARLLAAARDEGAWLELIIGSAAVTAVAEIAHSADRVLRRDPAYTAELAAWTRAAPSFDGVPPEAAGPAPQPGDVLPRRLFAGDAPSGGDPVTDTHAGHAATGTPANHATTGTPAEEPAGDTQAGPALGATRAKPADGPTASASTGTAAGGIAGGGIAGGGIAGGGIAGGGIAGGGIAGGGIAGGGIAGASGRARVERGAEPEPLVAVLGSPGDTSADQLAAGQALQRLLLTLTDAGLAASLVSQPIEVPAAREQLRLALGRYGPPQMVLRIGYALAGATTPRRPAATVIMP